MAPRRCPRSPPALMEELVEEIFLRMPPDEPAHLFRAALVCKPWRRILSDPGFLRRYRALHRAPPLLGYLHNAYRGDAHMIPTTSSSPLSPLPTFDCSESGIIRWVRDCRHGRVLFRCSDHDQLIVWDPITGHKTELSVPMFQHAYSAEAVLCAVDGCGHLDCHTGAFLVVCCGTNIVTKPYKTWVTVYSSETREWSALISIDVDHRAYATHTRLIRNTLYFIYEDEGNLISMLKYDLGRHELSVISSPPGVGQAVAMELDDGALGFVAALDDCIYTWSWQADANNGDGSWAQHMVMELETVLPRGNPYLPHQVMGLVEGTDTVFINVDAGLFTLDLKSRKVKKIGKSVGCCWIVIPYTSFYTPDCGRCSSLVSGEAC